LSDFVCDVSVVVAWAFEEEATPVSRRAFDLAGQYALLVPAVFPFELANVMAVAVRRGRLELSEARSFLVRIDELDIQEMAAAEPAVSLLDAAHRFGLTAYDAAYLDLAVRSGRPLATDDAALRKAAKRAGVTLV
jgi:predicted nucleic acid-binding protein